MEIASSEDDESMEEGRRGLIDLAYSIDDDYANTLSSIINVDEAKRKLVETQVKAKKEERQGRADFDFSSKDLKKSDDRNEYPSLAWSILGKLNASNYKFSRKPNYDLFFSLISGYSPVEAYPLYSLYISSVSLKCASPNLSNKVIRPIFEKSVDNIMFLENIFRNQGVLTTQPRSQIEDSNSILVNEDNKSQVVQFLKSWYQEIDKDFLDIIDPYFEPASLKKLIEVTGLEIEQPIRILTSEKQRKEIEKNSGLEIEETIKDFWNDNICSEGTLPDLKIISVGLQSLGDQMPIHDRWWLTGSSGIHLGTSTNALDKKRIYRISKLTETERENLDHTIKGFLEMSQSKYEGERVRFKLSML